MESLRRADSSTGPDDRRYDVLFELASGGMGKVCVARVRGTASFQRLVALKTIHPHLASETRFQDMFFEEARLAAMIHHPNVVPVLDLGRDATSFYLAMEYIPGEPLSRVLMDCAQSQTPIPLGASLRWMAEACAALHAAHELRDPLGRPLGLVHRDISPSNVLVTEYGTAKLTDFGIAKAVTSRDHTTAGALKGKMGYLSPEQVMGEKADRRSDVFSLGVTLFEVTTMRRLYGRGQHKEILESIARADFTDPRKIVPDYPSALVDVLRTALARERRNRFASAEAMGAAIERVARDLPSGMIAADVTAWVRDHLGDRFESRRAKIARALREIDGDAMLLEPPTTPSLTPHQLGLDERSHDVASAPVPVISRADRGAVDEGTTTEHRLVTDPEGVDGNEVAAALLDRNPPQAARTLTAPVAAPPNPAMAAQSFGRDAFGAGNTLDPATTRSKSGGGLSRRARYGVALALGAVLVFALALSIRHGGGPASNSVPSPVAPPSPVQPAANSAPATSPPVVEPAPVVALPPSSPSTARGTRGARSGAHRAAATSTTQPASTPNVQVPQPGPSPAQTTTPPRRPGSFQPIEP